MGLFFISWHCGLAAGEATASHCELLSQQGLASRPIGAIGVMATARRGTFCSAACSTTDLSFPASKQLAFYSSPSNGLVAH